MGNADSKAVGEDAESTVITSLPSKASQYTDFTSYDGDETLKSEHDNNGTRTKNRRNGEGKTTHMNGDQRDDKEVTNPPKITDDQIQVNLAMADLMAYLQVVANNSNHLPLTRRDDPELDRTVTTVTSEEYARKSAAFVPSDVRVIGGVFTRYGRVWDLPTSEEYNACDGALEPGRSYGGACCNSLLKVVYDAANDAAGAAQTEAASKALFEDDDDEDEETTSIMGKSFKSGFSLDYASPNSVKVTWADMLRQMRAEIKEIGYSQFPKITTTRKFDLNKPFSLLPDEFNSKLGRKRSLLIGCNYRGANGAELKASHDDVRSMKDYIVNVHGFPESNGLMKILMDDGEHDPPTFMNIIEAFKALSEDSQPGDAVFVQFAGHGGRVLDAANESEAESYDEVIVPTDYASSGLIRDTLIFKTLLAPMRFGVTVTIMIDCCDNGMVLELPYSWSTKADKKDSLAKLSMNEDFSFIRFLKVVKTLYETSTFTQLGRTVGSALNPMDTAAIKNDDHSEKGGDAEQKAQKEALLSKALSDGGNSIFDVLTEACSPSKRRRRSRKGKNGEAFEDNSKETLFEKVLTCSILSPEDEESDDETFKSRTEDESYAGYTDGGASFDDTMTDDGDFTSGHRAPSRPTGHNKKQTRK